MNDNNGHDEISDEAKQALADVRARISVGLQTWNRGVIDMCKREGVEDKLATVLIASELSLCLAFYLALMGPEARDRSITLMRAAAERIRAEVEGTVQQ